MAECEKSIEALNEEIKLEKLSHVHNLEQYKGLLAKERYDARHTSKVSEEEAKILAAKVHQLTDTLETVFFMRLIHRSRASLQSTSAS